MPKRIICMSPNHIAMNETYTASKIIPELAFIAPKEFV